MIMFKGATKKKLSPASVVSLCFKVLNVFDRLFTSVSDAFMNDQKYEKMSLYNF